MEKTIPIPQNVTLKNGIHAKTIERSWKKSLSQLAFLTLFCIAWNAFLVFWYSIALTKEDTPWIMIVFPIGHVGVGISLACYLFACFLNKTTFEISSHEVKIRHRPVFWFGNKKVPRSEIAQIFLKDIIKQNGNGSSRKFEIHMIDRTNHQLKLLGGLDDPQEALYLKQQLNNLLRLQPQPVAGAYEG